MDVYGVMREPLSRTISVFGNVFGIYKNRFSRGDYRVGMNSVTTNTIVETILNLISKSSSADKFQFMTGVDVYFPINPQSYWLKHNVNLINNIIVYPKFDLFLEKITGKPELQERLTVAPSHIKTELNSDLKKQIQELYKDDFDLWQQLNPHNS